jgi:hypothetical protein
MIQSCYHLSMIVGKWKLRSRLVIGDNRSELGNPLPDPLPLRMDGHTQNRLPSVSSQMCLTGLQHKQEWSKDDIMELRWTTPEVGSLAILRQV